MLGASGLWGVIAIGFFADNPIPLDTTNGRKGLFKGMNKNCCANKNNLSIK